MPKFLQLAFLIGLCVTPAQVFSNEFQLTKVLPLDSPWGITFIDDQEVVITEKTGKIIKVDLLQRKTTKIQHNLKIKKFAGQGGLLDVLYDRGKLIVSYSEERGENKSSTSVASAAYSLKSNRLVFKNIFQANPPYSTKHHFGSRLAVKDGMLYISLGERHQGKIAQNPQKHPGSIIRIYPDGSFPTDNPRFLDKPHWLPEIFQIGVRNPQGMAVSPYDNRIYISNHGARGGDFLGEVIKGTNYGWPLVGWGGRNYDGSAIGIGKAWEKGLLKPIYVWIPSIAVSAILIYSGKEFSEWNKHVLITSLKDTSLRKITLQKNKTVKEEIIFKGLIGRIRSIGSDSAGKVYLLSESPGALWRMEKK